MFRNDVFLSVFTPTRRGAKTLVKKLARNGINATLIHGNKSQNARTLALASFKDGRVNNLVATEVASRGIDVQGSDPFRWLKDLAARPIDVPIYGNLDLLRRFGSFLCFSFISAMTPLVEALAGGSTFF